MRSAPHKRSLPIEPSASDIYASPLSVLVRESPGTARQLINLSTHTASAVYQTFPAAEARRILRRLEFHYTPRHASWLNMAEIEIGVMRRQCLDRRIDNRDLLETEVRAWEHRRTASRAQIRWMFSTDQARVKMAKSYPTPSLNES